MSKNTAINKFTLLLADIILLAILIDCKGNNNKTIEEKTCDYKIECGSLSEEQRENCVSEEKKNNEPYSKTDVPECVEAYQTLSDYTECYTSQDCEVWEEIAVIEEGSPCKKLGEDFAAASLECLSASSSEDDSANSDDNGPNSDNDTTFDDDGIIEPEDTGSGPCSATINMGNCDCDISCSCEEQEEITNNIISCATSGTAFEQCCENSGGSLTCD